MDEHTPDDAHQPASATEQHREQHHDRLPAWLCHKRVHAAKIRDIERLPEAKGALLHLDVPDAPPLPVDLVWMAKHRPAIGGYFVAYEDGHTSYSPSDAFERGYDRQDGRRLFSARDMPTLYDDGARIVHACGRPTAGGAHARYQVREKATDHLLSAIGLQHDVIPKVGVVGWTNEALLAVVLDRLRAFQAGPYPCRENAEALPLVAAALGLLQDRTRRRRKAGTEGRHEEQPQPTRG